MGLIRPRPPMRKREARKIAAALNRHKELMVKYMERGLSREEASKAAYREMKPSAGKQDERSQ